MLLAKCENISIGTKNNEEIAEVTTNTNIIRRELSSRIWIVNNKTILRLLYMWLWQEWN